MTAALEQYRVRAQLSSGELELPCTTEAHALRWMRDMAAANPGVTVTVYSPRGEPIARETSAVRQ